MPSSVSDSPQRDPSPATHEDEQREPDRRTPEQRDPPAPHNPDVQEPPAREDPEVLPDDPDIAGEDGSIQPS